MMLIYFRFDYFHDNKPLANNIMIFLTVTSPLTAYKRYGKVRFLYYTAHESRMLT